MALRQRDITVNGGKARAGMMINDPKTVCFSHFILRKFALLQQNSTQKQKPGEDLVIPDRLVDLFQRSIVYEDDYFIIVNKPSGVAVQGGSKISLSLDLVAKKYNGEARLVHRIDKDTSGITVFAKNLETARYMLALFKESKVKKEYVAVLLKAPKNLFGTIDAPLRKTASNVVVDYSYGKNAITRYEVIDPKSNFVKLHPETGRTHQIRVHMASCLCCPIKGDNKYGQRSGNEKLLLHSISVQFIGPNGKEITAEASIPEYFKKHTHPQPQNLTPSLKE
jgi:23S rRNA pseudouridine955/2504/2580 synthase